MTSGEENFKTHGGFSASSFETQVEKPHITTRGKEGKALRKKLAMALGLKPNTSASTTSQSEGEDTQNVVDVFRKQVRMTVNSRKKSLPKITTQEEEQQSSDKNDLMIRKTIRRTTDISGEFLEEDIYEDFDDSDETGVDQRRSKDRHLMATEKLETFNHKTTSHDRTEEIRTSEKRKKFRETEDTSSKFLGEGHETINETHKASRKKSEEKDRYKKVETIDRRISDDKTREREGKNGILKTEFLDLKEGNDYQGSLSISARETRQLNSGSGLNLGVKVVEAEEIFSSFGEQSEIVPIGNQIEPSNSSAGESAKLLRQKIRKNARARQVSRGVDRHFREKTKDYRSQEKITTASKVTSENHSEAEFQGISFGSGKKDYKFTSNIPLLVAKRKTSDTKEKLVAENHHLGTSEIDYNIESINRSSKDLQSKPFQKSKIPRRKSQNAQDEMGNFATKSKVDEIEERSVGLLSTRNSEVVESKRVLGEESKKKDKYEREGSRSIDSFRVLQQNPWQKMDSNVNLSQLVRKFSKSSKDSQILQVTSRQSDSLSENRNPTNILKENTSLDTKITISTHKTTSSDSRFDFDSFEAELAKLKASVFKTYDDFKDIKELTDNVRDDLKELRDIYSSTGNALFCL